MMFPKHHLVRTTLNNFMDFVCCLEEKAQILFLKYFSRIISIFIRPLSMNLNLVKKRDDNDVYRHDGNTDLEFAC